MNEQCVVKSIYDVVKTINFLFMNLDEVTTTYHKSIEALIVLILLTKDF
jgi:hypothetical protein